MQDKCEVCNLFPAFKENKDGIMICSRCDGTIAETFKYSGERVKRNEECPCGSGKKFKKCCGSNRT